MRFTLCTGLVFAMMATTAPAGTISENEIKRLVLEAIRENPEIVLEAIQIIQEREERMLLADAQSSENAEVLGNPLGTITIVEFFDYNCHFCKRSVETVRAAIENHSDVRIVMREFPILSEGSDFAARAVLAAREQDMYEEFHWAMMDASRANEASVIATAEELGLDIEKLRSDMNAPEVEEHIRESRRLAEALDVTGTPAFLIGTQMVPGFITGDQLAQILDAERK
ncbi:MAG: DsbA family protein [Pseudomonadota bacterium]